LSAPAGQDKLVFLDEPELVRRLQNSLLPHLDNSRSSFSADDVLEELASRFFFDSDEKTRPVSLFLSSLHSGVVPHTDGTSCLVGDRCLHVQSQFTHALIDRCGFGSCQARKYSGCCIRMMSLHCLKCFVDVQPSDQSHYWRDLLD